MLNLDDFDKYDDDGENRHVVGQQRTSDDSQQMNDDDEQLTEDRYGATASAAGSRVSVYNHIHRIDHHLPFLIWLSFRVVSRAQE